MTAFSWPYRLIKTCHVLLQKEEAEMEAKRRQQVEEGEILVET